MSKEQILRETANRLFKGTASEYSALHRWVGKMWGRPQSCAFCKADSPGRYEWANLSGEYKRERSDWARLCGSCHRKYDMRKSHCPKGHEFTEDNTYMRPNGHRDCMQCNRDNQKRIYYVRKAQNER